MKCIKSFYLCIIRYCQQINLIKHTPLLFIDRVIINFPSFPPFPFTFPAYKAKQFTDAQGIFPSARKSAYFLRLDQSLSPDLVRSVQCQCSFFEKRHFGPSEKKKKIEIQLQVKGFMCVLMGLFSCNKVMQNQQLYILVFRNQLVHSYFDREVLKYG